MRSGLSKCGFIFLFYRRVFTFCASSEVEASTIIYAKGFGHDFWSCMHRASLYL